jgi:hypothetical protein
MSLHGLLSVTIGVPLQCLQHHHRHQYLRRHARPPVARRVHVREHPAGNSPSRCSARNANTLPAGISSRQGRLRMFARFQSGQADAPDDLDGLTVALLKRWRTANIGTNNGGTPCR